MACGLPVVATLAAAAAVVVAAGDWLGRLLEWEHTEPSTAEMTSPHSNAFSSLWMQLMVLPVMGRETSLLYPVEQ